MRFCLFLSTVPLVVGRLLLMTGMQQKPHNSTKCHFGCKECCNPIVKNTIGIREDVRRAVSQSTYLLDFFDRSQS